MTDGSAVAVTVGEAVGARRVAVGVMGSAGVAMAVAAPVQLVNNKLTNARSTTRKKIFFIWVLTFPNFNSIYFAIRCVQF